MSLEQNKAVVRRFYEAFGQNDVDTLEQLLAPDVEQYVLSASTPQSREEILQRVRMWDEAFSDTQYTIEEQLAEGDSVATRVSFRSTHSRGAFMGVPPSGKQITNTGISIERVRDGKIVERRASYDFMGIMQQLGLVPAM